MDPLSIWKSEWMKLSYEVDDKWISNFSAYVSARVTGKLLVAPPGIGSMVYKFNTSVFMSQLKNAKGLPSIAKAWKAAVMASIPVIPPGLAIGSPAPPTTFAVIASVVPVPAAGEAQMLSTLAKAKPCADPADCVMPEALYKAFMGLKFQIAGVNMVPPPAGPQPLSGLIGVK